MAKANMLFAEGVNSRPAIACVNPINTPPNSAPPATPTTVVACAVVRPQGIHGLTPKSVKKKLKQPSFAAAVNREDVRHGAEGLGVDFDEHVAFVIAALEARADELELHGSERAA